MGYGQTSKGQFGNIGNLAKSRLYNLSWLAAVLPDIPPSMDIIVVLGVLLLLLGSGYKMYRYKMALRDAQKTNASLLKICNILSSERQSSSSPVRSRLHHLLADAHQEEELPIDLVFLKTHISVLTDPQRLGINSLDKEPNSISLSPKERSLGRADQKLMENFSRLMREHMGDENLTQDSMAGKLGLSRSLYYEKIKNLMGVTPNEYLKNIRMQEAAHLLQEGEHTVSEVMLKVGFRDAKHFRDCFKKRYEKSPAEYTKLYQATYSH